MSADDVPPIIKSSELYIKQHENDPSNIAYPPEYSDFSFSIVNEMVRHIRNYSYWGIQEMPIDFIEIYKNTNPHVWKLVEKQVGHLPLFHTLKTLCLSTTIAQSGCVFVDKHDMLGLMFITNDLMADVKHYRFLYIDHVFDKIVANDWLDGFIHIYGKILEFDDALLTTQYYNYAIKHNNGGSIYHYLTK